LPGGPGGLGLGGGFGSVTVVFLLLLSVAILLLISMFSASFIRQPLRGFAFLGENPLTNEIQTGIIHDADLPHEPELARPMARKLSSSAALMAEL
jgi:hypothetical protein